MGLNYYNNSGDDQWAVQLDDLRYDSMKLKDSMHFEEDIYEIWDDSDPRIAYIDSGNTYI